MRTVALVLMIVIAMIASVDALYCSDGCTRGPLTATDHPGGGDCPICQPGAVPPEPDFSKTGLAIRLAPSLPEQLPLESVLRTIEHPPRLTA